jgi:hypothetical protein
MIVTFDFDSTLDKPQVQEYAKELIQRGIDVWVLTSRFDELHKHRYKINPTNDDLWKVIDELGLPRWKVRFTCMRDKAEYLYGTNVIWHLDDDLIELYNIRDSKCKTIGLSVKSSSWKQKCERLLKNAEKI